MNITLDQGRKILVAETFAYVEIEWTNMGFCEIVYRSCRR